MKCRDIQQPLIETRGILRFRGDVGNMDKPQIHTDGHRSRSSGFGRFHLCESVSIRGSDLDGGRRPRCGWRPKHSSRRAMMTTLRKRELTESMGVLGEC